MSGAPADSFAQSRLALVLGANGFLGRHLVARLKTEGYWVRAVTSGATYPSPPLIPASFLPGSGAFNAHLPDEVVVCDLRDPVGLSHIFWPGGRAFDEVYHLAANTGGTAYINSGDHDAEVMASAVLIDTNVAHLATSHRAGRLFFASSACVYGSSDRPFCLESDVDRERPENEYGWAKRFSERLYTAFHRNHGLDVKIARFDSIVGPHSPWRGKKEKAHSALARKVAEVDDGGVIDVLGDGKQTRTFLYVDDAIDAIRALMGSKHVADPVNIGSNHLVSIDTYLEVLKTVSGKHFTVNYVGGPTGARARVCSIAKIETQIGWRPRTSLLDATKRTYHWIETQLAEEKRA